METSEEAGQEVFTTGGEERTLDAAACTREEGKEEVEVSFDELGLDEQLERALRKKGIAKATPIQREAIPLILEGKDVAAKAKTGSGKTFAYLLPLLHELLKLSSEGCIRKPAPNAFILVPTRELCQQFFGYEVRKDVKGGHCLVAWPKVTRPLEYGGLGISQLQQLGWALRMRWLWLQKTEPKKPWAFIPIQVHLSAKAFFSVSVTSEVGNGMNTLFWIDRWLHGQSLDKLVPHLFGSVSGRAKKRSVHEALTDLTWVADIRGALSVAVLSEFLSLWDLLSEVVLQPEVEDSHIWKFAASGNYSAKSAYEAMFSGAIQFQPWERIWKSWALGKCKFFMWLVAHNKCWTADRLAKRELPHPDHCPLCDQEEETINQLLLACVCYSDVDKLTKLLLHKPFILTLSEVGRAKDDVIPKNVQQFWISCDAKDKMLHILALLKFELIQKKVLIFVNSIDMAFRLRLFLEKFGIRSAVLNAELPQNSRLHIIEAFNARLFDYLIATDDIKTKEKQSNKENKKEPKLSHKREKQTNKEKSKESKVSRKHLQQTLDAEFGVVRGIDFKNVFTVVNFDMPLDAAGYVHRIGRTGRANKTGASISLVSPEEDSTFKEIEHMLQDFEKKDIGCISPFPLLTKDAVESLRYRAQDVARSVTTRDIQEARRQDIMNEILNSEKLKSHFEENPRDLDLLKHDKLLSTKEIPAHLCDVPDYLIDPKTKEASNVVKLSRAAMGIDKPQRQKRQGFKGGSGKSRDPLKTFSAEGKRRRRRKDREGESDRTKKSRKKES